ncbi:MAG: ABC transporter substrate-binding protein [Egibacteraceae bacterium]
MRVRNNMLGAGLLLVVTLLAGACAGEEALNEGSGGSQPAATGGASGGGGGGGTVIVGSANFPEQLVLANMYADVIEDTGATVQRRLNLGSREVIFPSLRSGELTFLPEYSGALLAFLTEGEATAKNPDEVLSALREALPGGLVALEPAEAQDKDGLVVTQETAEEYNLETISDLEGVANELVVGGPAEMEERDVGLPGLKEVYGLEFKNFRALDAGGPLTTEALSSGQIDVGRVFTTQGVIDERGWVVLEDDKELAPAQEIVPIAQENVLTEEIRAAVNELSAALTTEDLTALNKLVEVDKEDPESVARQYLEENGLIGG